MEYVVVKTRRTTKVLGGLLIALFALFACVASQSILTSIFILAFAAVAAYFLLRDEKVLVGGEGSYFVNAVEGEDVFEGSRRSEYTLALRGYEPYASRYGFNDD